MHNIHPTRGKIALFASSSHEGPIVMENLLRFKRKNGEIDREARDSYYRYMDGTTPFLEGVGGCLIWMGKKEITVIGDQRDEWDLTLLVEYPSREAFLRMTSYPEYLKVHLLREDRHLFHGQ